MELHRLARANLRIKGGITLPDFRLYHIVIKAVWYRHEKTSVEQSRHKPTWKVVAKTTYWETGGIFNEQSWKNWTGT